MIAKILQLLPSDADQIYTAFKHCLSVRFALIREILPCNFPSCLQNSLHKDPKSCVSRKHDGFNEDPIFSCESFVEIRKVRSA